MRTCLKCNGAGKIHTPAGLQNDLPCWLCECTGILPAPDLTALTSAVLSQRTGHPYRQLFAPHKQALGLMWKKGPWGKTPHTLEEAEALWRATIFGRRCTYVHMMLQHALDKRCRVRHLIVHSCKQDAYIKELNDLIEMILGGINYAERDTEKT